MCLDIDFRKELRRDEERVCCQGAGTLLQVFVCVNVATRPAMNDDNGSRNIGLLNFPITRDAYWHLTYAGCGLHVQAVLQHHRYRAVNNVDFGRSGKVRQRCAEEKS